MTQHNKQNNNMEQMNNLEAAIAGAVANYIHGHCSQTGVVCTNRLLSYPERFVHAEHTGDGALLAFADDVSRDYYGQLNYSREWLYVELLVEGVRFDVKHPLPQDELGASVYTHAHNAGTTDGLRAFFQEVRGGKAHPIFNTNGLRVQRNYTSGVSSTDRIATWSAHGRPVATLNKWLKRFSIPTLDTTQGNELLAAIDDVLQEQKASCSWAEGGIGRFYSAHASTPYSSCMAGADEDWFGLYDHMQSRGQLKLLNITRDGTHIGRALVWFGSNPDDKYLDRVYAPPYRDSFEPDIIRAIQEFCREEGIEKTVYEQTSERIGLQHVGGFSIQTGACPYDFSHYPYVDSLRYFGHDGRLRSQNSHNCIVLDQTNGGPNEDEDEDEDYVTLENGDRVPEDEARYSNLFGEWYGRDDVTWSNLHDDWIPDSNLVELHDGTYTHDVNPDCVRLHNDDGYALIEDCVELHDGGYALTDDCVQLHDGEYALTDDACTLHDGEYALNDDVCTLPDGRVVLLADCTELDDGTHVLTSEQSD